MIGPDEHLLDLKKACSHPYLRHRGGKPAHISSVYRFVTRGARDANGNRLRLETIRTPRGLCTSSEAIERFIKGLTDPDGVATRTETAKRREEILSANRDLKDAGFELAPK